MTKVKDWLVAAGVLVLGRGQRRPPKPEHRIVEPGAPSPTAELAVLVLFGLVSVAGIAFVVLYALRHVSHRTQWLGLSLGGAFVVLAAACAVISKKLVVDEELVHGYPEPEHPGEQGEIEQIVEESGSRFTRKRLVLLAGLGALGSLGLAVLTPAASLGPALDVGPLQDTPWRRGRRIVGVDGRRLKATDIEPESFYTGYPEGADRELMGSPIVIVHTEQKGIVAFSKICTHAGCAISLYRKPTFAPVDPKPALVCPCHYSTFDPANSGKVLFGPAGRPLPELPLMVDGNGDLRAAGNFNAPVGPSWWGVRQRKARSA